MKVRRKPILLISVFALLVLAVAVFWFINRPQPVSGSKTITVEVLHGNGSEKTFIIHTNAETLREACEEQDLIAGQEGEYGLYVLTVDGETADEAIQQWWCITKGGEEHFYGVDDTMVQDGEQYEFTLKTGW